LKKEYLDGNTRFLFYKNNVFFLHFNMMGTCMVETLIGRSLISST